MMDQSYKPSWFLKWFGYDRPPQLATSPFPAEASVRKKPQPSRITDPGRGTQRPDHASGWFHDPSLALLRESSTRGRGYCLYLIPSVLI
jgi:hypothetical protein